MGGIRSIQRPRMTRRDDSLIGQVVAANVVLVALTLFAASLAAGLDLTVREQRWQFLILAMSIVLSLCVNLWMLHRRSGQLAMRAQEGERRRLARDLHDEVNQALTAILLRLEALAQDTPPERAPEVAELKRLVNQAMEELLTLARQLRPSALDDHGLVPAVEAQLKRFSARTGIEVRLHTEGDPNELPEVMQTAIFRVAQEALANVARHAGATIVEVELDEEDGRAELRVRDDGAGFDPGAIPRAGTERPGAGLGLGGMAERARLVGGELDVRSAPGGGTSVTLRVGSMKQTPGGGTRVRA